MTLRSTEHYAPNADGWLLHLKQTVDLERLDRSKPPVLIVPGYGMNSFIFGFHPKGTSMERTFAEAGFEVWSANLRLQGGSRPTVKRAPEPSMRAFADVDVPAVVRTALDRTETHADNVSLIGCSLGGTLAYGHLALEPNHQVGRLITVGSPLRWLTLHPLLRAAAASPRLIGAFRMRGTREMARLAFPMLAKVPGLLNIYMNPKNVDVAAAGELVRTIEDPHHRLNRDLAIWVNQRDLILRGVNVSQAIGRETLPLLVVVGNRDGIVPEDAALSALDAWGGTDVEVLRVGDDEEWYAHADLFIGDRAPERVFAPIIGWLDARG